MGNQATAASALRLLQKKGTTYTITRTTGTANPAEPWKPDVFATQTQSAYGILDDFSDSVRNGTTILNSDRKYTIAASGLTFKPDAGDKFIDQSASHEIISVGIVRAADVDVLYNIHARS